MAGKEPRSARVRATGIAAHVRAGVRGFTCQLEELSKDGALLRTDQAVDSGTPLEIALVKPGGRKAIRIHGSVGGAAARSNGGQPGLEVMFTSIDDEDLQRLAAWLEELKTRASGASPPEDVIPGPSPPDDEDILENVLEDILPAFPQRLPAAPKPALQPATVSEKARMMLQIKGMLQEMDELRGQLRQRDAELEQLRSELAMAERLIGKPRKPE
jgi:hypothetical protein